MEHVVKQKQLPVLDLDFVKQKKVSSGWRCIPFDLPESQPPWMDPIFVVVVVRLIESFFIVF